MLKTLVTNISRTPRQTTLLRMHVGRKSAAFALLITLVLLFSLVLFAHCASEWQAFHLQVPLPDGSWRMLEHASLNDDACANTPKPGPACPAHPENSSLWNSTDTRRQGDWTTSTKATVKRPRRFWIGANLGRALLEKARDAGANKFLIGSINGDYRVWLDGQLVASGEGWAETEPVVIAVPVPRLYGPESLHIAVDIENTNGAAFPDLFNRRNGGEGFLTTKAENAYRSKMTMLYRVRPFSLAVAYAVVSLLFFLIWRASPLRQEYYWIAIFSAVSALFTALTVDMLQFQLPPAINYSLMNACLYAHAFVGLFLGMSFARLRPGLFRAGLWLLGMTCSALLASGVLGLAPHSGQVWMWRFGMEWVRPACFAAASAVCLAQAWMLYRMRKGGAALPIRTQRLTIFGIGMGAFASMYFIDSRSLIPEAYVFYRLFRGYEYLAGIVCLASVAMKEFSVSEAFVQRSPVSSYHQRPELPEKISGALLSVDLKNSESLARIGEQDGNAGTYVGMVLSHLWNAVTRQGGFVLQTDGDGLRAFFDSGACADPMKAALAAIDDMHAELDVVEGQLKFQYGLNGLSCRLRFRAGVARGDIRPVWQEHGSERHASWVAVGNRHVFVEAARLLELERRLEGAALANYALFTEEDAKTIYQGPLAHRGSWVMRDKTLLAKHNRAYHVAVYNPALAPAMSTSLERRYG